MSTLTTAIGIDFGGTSIKSAVIRSGSVVQRGAPIDPQAGPGAESLCAVWTDPAFDPAEAAFYYARVLENPTCRWSAWECLALSPGARPTACSDPEVPKTIQERAWTSPIWWDGARS